jgi:hypothetical protein
VKKTFDPFLFDNGCEECREAQSTQRFLQPLRFLTDSCLQITPAGFLKKIHVPNKGQPGPGTMNGASQQKINRSYPDSYRDRYHKKIIIVRLKCSNPCLA